MKSAAICRQVVLEGRGLFSGENCRAVVKPATIGSGICFIKDGARIPALAANYIKQPNCSVLGSGTARIAVVEHLLAAMWCAGIDSAEIEVNGSELPNRDGSGLWQYEQLLTGGRVEGAPRPTVRCNTPIRIGDSDDTFIEYTPGDGSELEVSYLFTHPELGRQKFLAKITREYAASMVMPARTFITETESNHARAAGFLKNDNEHDALVIRNGVPNSDYRFDDEFARHKVLDLLGDLYVVPGELTGRINACRSGHAMNRELARQLAGKV